MCNSDDFRAEFSRLDERRHEMQSEIDNLRAEVFDLKDKVTLERNRGDFCAAVADNLEKGFYPALELAKLENNKLKALLKDLEWRATNLYGCSCCPICSREEPDGHTDYCDLAALLRGEWVYGQPGER